MTPEPRPQANSYFRWLSSYHIFQTNMLPRKTTLRILRFHCFSRALTSENCPNPLFQIKPSQALSKEILFQTGTPCQVSFNSFYRGISNLSIWVKGSQVRSLATKSSRLEFIRLARGSSGSRGSQLSGVISRRSEAPFHTHRGPGWRELNKLPQKREDILILGYMVCKSKI